MRFLKVNNHITFKLNHALIRLFMKKINFLSNSMEALNNQKSKIFLKLNIQRNNGKIWQIIQILFKNLKKFHIVQQMRIFIRTINKFNKISKIIEKIFWLKNFKQKLRLSRTPSKIILSINNFPSLIIIKMLYSMMKNKNYNLIKMMIICKIIMIGNMILKNKTKICFKNNN